MMQASNGANVTIAFIDTGVAKSSQAYYRPDDQPRFLAGYDAIQDQMLAWNDNYDESGHGSHVIGIAANPVKSSIERKFNGIAPYANLVSVKAFDGSGAGSYLDVIRGIDWVVANKDVHNIRVLNLSFSSTPQSYYWDDPLNQAVMRAWQAGIVVVASAGNDGPDAMTIGVPGNIPYIITVGAMSDNYTPKDGTDDILASFSAAGPTVEGFVKPEIVAPGGHMLSLMRPKARIAQDHPEFHDSKAYFMMSGTSQATAVTSGIAALMLQHDPTLTPDDVKCRLMSAANPAVNDNGNLAYSIFQQGAGLVNAYDAVYSTISGCANNGLDVDADLAGTAHFGGRANQR